MTLKSMVVACNTIWWSIFRKVGHNIGGSSEIVVSSSAQDDKRHATCKFGTPSIYFQTGYGAAKESIKKTGFSSSFRTTEVFNFW